MTPRDTLDRAFALLSTRDLADALPAVEAARTASATAQGSERLALHEAIVEGLDVFLSDLGEHGAANWPSWGTDPAAVDPAALVAEYTAAWAEVKRLRAAGIVSQSLSAPHTDGWVHPVGGRDWLSRIKLSVPYYAEAGWLARATRNVQEAVDASRKHPDV